MNWINGTAWKIISYGTPNEVPLGSDFRMSQVELAVMVNVQSLTPGTVVESDEGEVLTVTPSYNLVDPNGTLYQSLGFRLSCAEPLPCKLCGKLYNTSSLNEHVRRKHADN